MLLTDTLRKFSEVPVCQNLNHMRNPCNSIDLKFPLSFNFVYEVLKCYTARILVGVKMQQFRNRGL
jgi:hypothetical protein